jgi:hypothetical protein
MEPGAPFVNILCVNLTAMRFNDRTHDGEAHSQAFFFGREKLLEQSLPYFVANSGAVVANTNGHGSIAVVSRQDFNRAIPDRRIAHGIECIAYEINQDLFNLDWIALDRGKPFAKECLHFARVRRRIWPNHADHSRHRFV